MDLIGDQLEYFNKLYKKYKDKIFYEADGMSLSTMVTLTS